MNSVVLPGDDNGVVDEEDDKNWSDEAMRKLVM